MQHIRDETPDEGSAHVLDVLQDDEHQDAARSSIELEAILRAMADGLIEVDRAGRIVRMNPAARSLIGLDAERDYVSHPLAQRLALLHLCDSQGQPLPEEAWPALRLLRGESLQGNEAMEVRLTMLDGRELDLSVSGTPMADEQGQITGAIMVLRNVTERKRHAEILRASEERYRTIVQIANEGVWLIDIQARTLYANAWMAALLGVRTAAEMEGRTILEFVYPEDEPEGRERIGRTLHGHVEHFEFRFRRQDGSELYVLASTSRVHDAAGRVVGALGLFTDITARKHTELALSRSETLLDLALKNSSITLYQQDRDLRYTWVSHPPGGALPEEIVGKTDADFVLPEEAQQLTQLKQRVLLSGESVRAEVRITREAQERTQVLTVEPWRDHAGAIVGVTGSAIDLTAQKRLEHERARLEQEARRRANELEALFEAMTDGIFVYDAADRLQRTNATARALLARYMQAEEMFLPVEERVARSAPHRPDGTPLPPEQVPSLRILRGEVLTGANMADVVVRTLAGEDLWLNMSGTPLRDEQGQITGAVAIARDVTAERLKEQRTQHVLEALLEMAQAMVQGATGDGSQDRPITEALRPVMQRIAALTRDVVGCQRLGFVRVEPETTRLRPLAVVGLSPEQEQQWWREQEQQDVRLCDGIRPISGAALAG